MAPDDGKGAWKPGKGKGRRSPKGRQFEDQTCGEVRTVLGGTPYRRYFLIGYLHLVQDKFGHL